MEQGVFDVQMDEGPFGSGWRLVVPFAAARGSRVSCVCPETLKVATLPRDAFRGSRKIEGAERRVAARLDRKRKQHRRLGLCSYGHSQKVRQIAEVLRCVADGWA